MTVAKHHAIDDFRGKGRGGPAEGRSPGAIAVDQADAKAARRDDGQ